MAPSEQDLLATLKALGWWQREVSSFVSGTDTYVAAITARQLVDNPTLSGIPFGELLPGLELLSGAAPTNYLTGVRPRGAITKWSNNRWSDLATHSALQILSWPQVGHKTCRAIIRGILRGWADQNQGFAYHPITPAPSDTKSEAHYLNEEHLSSLRDLALDLFCSGATTVADALSLLSTPEAHFVGLDSIRDTRLADLLGLQDAATAWEKLFDLDDLALFVVQARIYPTDSRRTLDDIGTELGLTRERIRQIEKHAKVQINAMLDTDPDLAPVLHDAASLRQELGSVTSDEYLNSALRDRVDGDGALADLRRAALRELAGPYTCNGDLWELEGRLRDIESILLAGADRPLSDGELNDLLDSHGVLPEARQHVLGSMPLHRFGNQNLVWTGSLEDKAFLILSVHGEPMSRNDIHHAMGADTVKVRSLSNAIASDERFRRLGRDRYGLAMWGGEEYSGIEDQIARVIENQGGKALLDDVVTELVERFGVSPNSVRSYAGSTRFQRDRDGGISLASVGGERRVVADKPADFDRALSLVEGVRIFGLTVDADLLRGSGRPVRIAVAQAAGVRPSETRAIMLANGQVTLYWRGNQPALGSLKTLADSLNCEEGDRLFLPLKDGEDAYVVSNESLNQLAGIPRVALELGIMEQVPDLELIAAALGLDPGGRLIDIHTRLKARRQPELSLHLRHEDPGDNDDLEELKGLGA